MACKEKRNPSLLWSYLKKYISEYVQKQVEVSHLKYDVCDKFYALMETHEFIWMNDLHIGYAVLRVEQEERTD
jgi:hypothetical protein